MKMNDKEKIDAMAKAKECKVFAGRRLSKWFEIDITIKIFGQVIFSWHYPPESDSVDD